MSTSSPDVVDPRAAGHDVWVLAGQSNMQGRAWLDGALPPDDRVWSFSSAGVWEIAEEPLHRLWESFAPVHQDFMRVGLPPEERDLPDAEFARREDESRTTGAGLGIAFGSAMADHTGKPIGLIPASHGGTSLDQWSPSLRHLEGRSLYGAMLQRIAKAGGNLRGILWYQGESDGGTAELGRTYLDRMVAWIEAVRSDTGIADLPVVVVQIGRVIEAVSRQGSWPGWDLVREALGNLPERVANTAVTTAIDLPMTDAFHVATDGLIRLGRRLARLALALTEEGMLPHGPVMEDAQLVVMPSGQRNGICLHFSGVSGKWSRGGEVRGLRVRQADWEERDSLHVVNAWAEDGNSIMLLLSREPEEGSEVLISYGMGLGRARRFPTIGELVRRIARGYN